MILICPSLSLKEIQQGICTENRTLVCQFSGTDSIFNCESWVFLLFSIIFIFLIKYLSKQTHAWLVKGPFITFCSMLLYNLCPQSRTRWQRLKTCRKPGGCSALFEIEIYCHYGLRGFVLFLPTQWKLE